jgi:signal transduction histidine kinase
MPDRPGRGAAARRPLIVDLSLAACVALPGLFALPWSNAGTRNGSAPAAAIAMLIIAGASVIVRGRWPVAAAVAASAGFVVGVQTGGFDPSGSSVSGDLITIGVLLWTVVMGFTLGGSRPLRWSVVGLLAVVVATQWDDLHHNANPFPTVLAIGAWAIGWIVRSRGDLIIALDARAAELASERLRYAAEAVRYERAWIARELHDVIAHSMSIVVVQASAGQRLGDCDLTATNQVFDDIGELARQAESDLAGLSQLLSRQQQPPQLPPRELIDQLVAHAATAGTSVVVTVAGDLDAMPNRASATLHRVLQEGLTNAIKYASGAPVAIRVAAGTDATTVEVENQPGSPSSLRVYVESGGNGLRGLHERIAAMGGEFHTQATPSGGWLLSATIPAEPALDDVRPAALRLVP